MSPTTVAAPTPASYAPPTSGFPALRLTATSPTEPVAADERVAFLDVLRGFALWGVCLANLVPWFSGYDPLPEKAKTALATWPADRITEMLLRTFVHGRFIMLFSFMFGVGFAIQLVRAESRGEDPTRRLARRLAAMAAIGVVHAFAIWYGDILLSYAVMGTTLLVARRWPPRRLLAVGLALLLLEPMAWGVYVKLAPIATHGALSPAAHFAAADTLYTHTLPALIARGSYPAIVEANARMVGDITSVWVWPSWMPEVAGLFLLGLCVGRLGLLHRIDAHRDRWRLAFGWSVTIALLGYGPRLVIEITDTAKVVPLDILGLLRALRIVGTPAMSLAYACGLVLLFQRPAWRRRLLVLAPLGRMALTNYLAQSVIGVVLFYGIGFGLYGTVGATLLVALSIAIIAVQAVFSRWWLARHRFGPAEWLWRSLTYGRRQPMRVAVPSPVDATA